VLTERRGRREGERASATHQILQGLADIQDGFDAGTDDRHRRTSEFRQIRANVESWLGSPVNATDTTCCHYRNTCRMCDQHRGTDGRTTVQVTRYDVGDVPARALDGLGWICFSQNRQLLITQPDLYLATYDAYRCWYGALKWMKMKFWNDNLERERERERERRGEG